MGTRFTRCMGLTKYKAVLDSNAPNDIYGSDAHDIMAVAIELDEDESKNTGLILPTNNEV